ncbi:MAG: hypothetical protein HKO01_04790 [Flaviramulus sp.]|nr:hypothetical protein [Flaviramulus sp.]NNC49832.1 hypothetical protein [Flaviramulus sp.]
MATKTKAKAKTAAKKVNKPNVAKKVNTSLLNVSIAAINTTIDNGEKWQKLASKLIKKSEKVREQQINMIFDTAESVKGQFMVGADKMKDLVGYDAELVEKAKAKVINNPVSRKVVGIVEDITEKVSENPMVQKAEKATEDIKNMGMAKYNDLKGDVLKQASKVVNKAEAIIEDAKSAPKSKVTKKVAPKKTVAKKATKTVAKVAPKKAVVKKTAATKAKATPKKTVVKKVTTTKASAPKTTAVKTETAINKETVANVAEVKVDVQN